MGSRGVRESSSARQLAISASRAGSRTSGSSLDSHSINRVLDIVCSNSRLKYVQDKRGNSYRQIKASRDFFRFL